MKHDRVITEFEELVLRMCHHQFDALSQAEAATKLVVSEATIYRTLQEIESKVPTMFPILTRKQYEVYTCVATRGLSLRETAEELHISEGLVQDFLTRIRAKGMMIPPPVKTVRYDESMDSKVKHIF